MTRITQILRETLLQEKKNAFNGKNFIYFTLDKLLLRMYTIYYSDKFQ